MAAVRPCWAKFVFPVIAFISSPRQDVRVESHGSELFELSAVYHLWMAEAGLEFCSLI